MKERVTIRDIADASGVSESTVSRILNHKGKYAPETIEAVQKAAEELNYSKSRGDSRNRVGNTNLVGIMVPSVENECFSSLSQRIAQGLHLKGYAPVLCITGENPEREVFYEKQLSNIGVSGMVYLMWENDVIPAAKDIPSIFVGTAPENAEGDSILFDIVEGGKKATEELLSSGCKHIVYLYSDRHRIRHMGRFLGYQQALWAHRIETDPELVFTVGGEDYPSVKEVLNKLAEKNIAFDGVFANQTRSAVECYAWLKENSVFSKEQVRMISFEDGLLAEASDGGITALKLDLNDISMKAVDMLAERLENKDKEKQVVWVSYGLIRRRSTGTE